KILVGIIGGRMYGLTKRVSLRAGLSMCARGEFSVVIASVATGSIRVFAGIYIIISAFIGMVLFNYAPKITTLIYVKPIKKKTDLKIPTMQTTDITLGAFMVLKSLWMLSRRIYGFIGFFFKPFQCFKGELVE